jgi:hypothetical protein
MTRFNVDITNKKFKLQIGDFYKIFDYEDYYRIIVIVSKLIPPDNRGTQVDVEELFRNYSDIDTKSMYFTDYINDEFDAKLYY